MKSLNFWRSLFFSALAAAAFGACSDDDKTGDFEASITVDGKKATTVGIVAAGGETAAVSVVSAGPWTLAFESDQDWCLPNVTSGKGGTTELVFTADPMPESIEERSTTVVLTAWGWFYGVNYPMKASVTVRQSASGSLIPTTNVAKVRELLKAMNPSSTAADVTAEIAAMTITGIVGSESSGVNLGNNRNFAIQDEDRAQNSGLTINASSAVSLKAGQVVSIPLSGAKVSLYSGALQLSVDNASVKTVAETDAPEPVIVTPATLPNYESMLVQVDNCYPAAGYGTAWNNNSNKGSVNFMTAAGETFVCRVGAQCTFKDSLIPEKSGSLAGIAVIFVSNTQAVTWQVSPRTLDDIKLTEPIPAPEYKAVTIDQITAAGNYKVENATVVATYKAGFLMQDNTGIILVYPGAGTTENPVTIPAAGKVVTVEGAVSSYGGVLQFGQGSTVTETGTGTVPTPPQPVEITADNIAGYMTAPKVAYVKATGVMNISGTYYNFDFLFESDYTGSVSSPNDDLGLAALNKELVDIEGWFVNNGNASGTGKYFTMVATKVAKNETIPVLTFTSAPKAFAGSSPEPQTVNFIAQNIPAGQSVEFTFDDEDADKFTVVSSTDTSVTINAVGDNSSAAAYTATLVAKLGGTELDRVSVTQAIISSGTGYTKITTAADLTAGDYYLGGYGTTNKTLQLFTGVLKSSNGETSAYTYENGQLSTTGTEAAIVTLEAAGDGYKIKVNGKYLTATKAATGGLALVDSSDAYWTFSDASGIIKQDIKASFSGVTDSGVIISTTAGSNVLRSWKMTGSNEANGLVFFKAN